MLAAACVSESDKASRASVPPPPGVTTSASPRRSASAAPVAKIETALAKNAPAAPPAPPEEPGGQADRDPSNDDVVAPPDAVADCHERLMTLGATFQPAELPLRQKVNGIPTCGANDAVLFQRGPSGMVIKPPALVTCRLALALVDLDALAQELAKKELGAAIKALHQGGTYNCRKMARFDLVSEHSYGNAIDVRSFTLVDGRLVNVDKHFGKLAEPPQNERARFLRSLGEQAFDRGVVSVSLGPYWDALHEDHFHFDMARYRVDGSRQR
jgi:hypothetical protein